MRKKPADQQVGFLHQLITTLVRSIVEHEGQVQIDCSLSASGVMFVVRVNHEDVGLVIGERGATADAIRRIVWTACKKTNVRADIDIL